MFKNEFKKAKATFDSSIQIEKRLFGMKDSLSLASFTCCLGAAYYHLDDFAHSKLLFQEGMRINSQLARSDESCIVYSLCWLGRLHRRMNEPQKALERYLSALQRCKKILSIDYRVVVHLLHVIGEVYEEETVNLQQMSLMCTCSWFSYYFSISIPEDKISQSFIPHMLSSLRLQQRNRPYSFQARDGRDTDQKDVG